MFPAPTSFRFEFSHSFRGCRGFFHSSFLHHIALSRFFPFLHSSFALSIECSSIPPCDTHSSLPHFPQRHCAFDAMDPLLDRRANRSKRSSNSHSLFPKIGGFPYQSSPFACSMGSFTSPIPFCSHRTPSSSF